MTSWPTFARDMSSAKPHSTHSCQAALLVGPSDWSCVVEPLGVVPVGSELGGDGAGFVLGLKNPLTASASSVNTFFFGVVVGLDVFGVALLPSSVTLPSVGRGSDSVVAAGVSVGEEVPEPDGVCGGAGSVAAAIVGSSFTSDSEGSCASDFALIAGEFVGATGAGSPVTKLVTPCPIAPGTPAIVSRIRSGGVINEN